MWFLFSYFPFLSGTSTFFHHQWLEVGTVLAPVLIFNEVLYTRIMLFFTKLCMQQYSVQVEWKDKATFITIMCLEHDGCRPLQMPLHFLKSSFQYTKLNILSTASAFTLSKTLSYFICLCLCIFALLCFAFGFWMGDISLCLVTKIFYTFT